MKLTVLPTLGAMILVAAVVKEPLLHAHPVLALALLIAAFSGMAFLLGVEVVHVSYARRGRRLARLAAGLDPADAFEALIDSMAFTTARDHVVSAARADLLAAITPETAPLLTESRRKALRTWLSLATTRMTARMAPDDLYLAIMHALTVAQDVEALSWVDLVGARATNAEVREGAARAAKALRLVQAKDILLRPADGAADELLRPASGAAKPEALLRASDGDEHKLENRQAD